MVVELGGTVGECYAVRSCGTPGASRRCSRTNDPRSRAGSGRRLVWPPYRLRRRTRHHLAVNRPTGDRTSTEMRAYDTLPDLRFVGVVPSEFGTRAPITIAA